MYLIWAACDGCGATSEQVVVDTDDPVGLYVRQSLALTGQGWRFHTYPKPDAFEKRRWGHEWLCPVCAKRLDEEDINKDDNVMWARNRI